MSTSTVFLPFITAKSSEEAIFKSIVQRTKGSSSSTIANLFAIVLSIGIDKIRKKLDSYPTNLTTSAKIKELVSDHTEVHIQKSETTFWTYVMRMEQKSGEAHPIFNKEELRTFFSVLASRKPKALSAAGFGAVDHKKYLKYSENSFDIGCSSIKNLKITEKDSERVGFTCWEEFKTYIAFSLSDDSVTSILPVFISNQDRELTAQDYENSHCSSPYRN